MAQISKLWAVVGQFLPPTKGANSLEGKFLGVVTLMKTGGAEFGYPLDLSGQTRCHLQFPSLIIDKWRVELPVHPLWLDMHINQEPLRLRTPP
jgi:hypothetical protein